MISFLGLLWVVEFLNLLSGHAFHTWGILPRTQTGLRGIPFAPFLHQGPEHLALNTVPLAVLGWLVLLRGPMAFLRVSLTIVLVTGVGVWAFGRPYYHLGASGLVVGYFGYLVARAFYERSWRSMLIATITLLLYGGLIASVLPSHPEVSWESHLGGLLGGIAAAWAGAGRRRSGG